MKTLQSVIDYWFEKPDDYQKWFFSGEKLDKTIRDQFSELLEYETANNISYDKVIDKVGKIILLDQFSRHIYRGTPKAFSSDTISLEITNSLLTDAHVSEFNKLPTIYKMFALMPLQHSENIEDKTRLLEWSHSQLNKPDCDEAATNIYKSLVLHTKGHLKVLEQFGRYPKRNQALNRESTKEELIYLEKNPNGAY